MKWVEGAKQGIVVAGGQREGNGLTQLSYPEGVVVDQLGTVYVADDENDRIMRWPKGATQGSVIVGGNGRGEQSNQLKEPIGLSFDRHGNLYVVDWGNHRVQKFNVDSTVEKLIRVALHAIWFFFLENAKYNKGVHFDERMIQFLEIVELITVGIL
ncbi:unnamed protein product [Rotaria sp. Silwood2]|nr:unnamed protein product [Rotaria sp. Silwood2]